MPTLQETLLAPQHREAVIADCARRVESHVAALKGVRGLSLRAGLSALRAVRPDALTRGVARLLPEFAAALDPLYQRFRASGDREFSRFLAQHSGEAAAALMAVTDARAAASSHAGLRAGYRRLRGALASELERTLPELAAALSAHLARPR